MKNCTRTVLFVVLFLSSCAPSTKAVQTAIVQTLTAFPTASVTPRPTPTFTPVLSPYSLQVGVCSVYIDYGGDPKALGCTPVKTLTVSLAADQEASADVTAVLPDAYAYCALFAADGRYVTSFVNPSPGAIQVRCGPQTAGLPTAAPDIRTTLVAAQAASQTAVAMEFAAARTAVERQVRAYATSDSATATAYYIAARATQTASERQARVSATAFSATATAAFKAARATEISQYGPINLEDLLTDPSSHTGDRIVISGQVYEAHANVIQIYVQGRDAVYVETRAPVSGIAVGDPIRVYGTVGGINCFAGETGAQVCLPALTDAFYVKK